MKRFLNVLFLSIIALSCFLPATSVAKKNNGTEQCFKGGPRIHKSSISPWISRKDNTFVYKFNVFNLDPLGTDQATLQSILCAIKKDVHENYRKDWGVDIDIKLYTGDQITNPDLFNGDRIPVFIQATNNIGSSVLNQASEPANSDSFLWAGNSITDTTDLTVPSNFPFWTPYIPLSTSVLKNSAVFHAVHNNFYGIQDFYQYLSWELNHEMKQLMTNDSFQIWDVFDNFAPTVATWHYGVFNNLGVCTNSIIGPDGFAHLPFFLDVFPAGGLFTVAVYNCAQVTSGLTSQLTSYPVDGWLMSNYATSNNWKSYYESNCIKWDKRGFVEMPMQPYAGEIVTLFFLDFNTGETSVGVVNNFGPVTASQRNQPPANNFPPDYTFVQFFENLGCTATAEQRKNALKRARSLFRQKTAHKA